MDDAFLSKLADAGTNIMHIGAESGSDRILKLIRKNLLYRKILFILDKIKFILHEIKLNFISIYSSYFI